MHKYATMQNIPSIQFYSQLLIMQEHGMWQSVFWMGLQSITRATDSPKQENWGIQRKSSCSQDMQPGQELSPPPAGVKLQKFP